MKNLFILSLFLLSITSTFALAQVRDTENTQTNKNRFKGVEPWFDITAYGARAVSSPPTDTDTSCDGSTIITLGSAPAFQNGDGVVVYGCGPIETMRTPGARALRR